MQTYCPNKAWKDFFFFFFFFFGGGGPKSETFFWKEIVITEEWKRVMPPNYVHKIAHISALFCQSLNIISASGRKLLKMKNSKSFL